MELKERLQRTAQKKTKCKERKKVYKEQCKLLWTSEQTLRKQLESQWQTEPLPDTQGQQDQTAIVLMA